MTVQRRVLTQPEIDERNRRREERSKIQDLQVDVLEKLYSSSEEMEKFIIAIHAHFPFAAGERSEVLQIAKAVRKPFRRTCDLLTALSKTGIGGIGTKRMILDDVAQPFTHFKWHGNLNELVLRLNEKWDSEQSNKVMPNE